MKKWVAIRRSEYRQESVRLLLAAVAGQAVYDFQAAVRAGALTPAGQIGKPRLDDHCYPMGHGVSRLAACLDRKDLANLARQVRSDDWVSSMRLATGLPCRSAAEFRRRSLERPCWPGATKRFRIPSQKF